MAEWFAQVGEVYLLRRTLACLLAFGAMSAPAHRGLSQIVDGFDAPPTPWQVQLVFTGELSMPADGSAHPRPPWSRRHVCGGTLIAPSWVLTAAHCVHDDVDGRQVQTPDAALRVRAGLRNIEHLEPGFEERGVRIFVIPTYRRSKVVGEDGFPAHHDFALLRLDRPMPLNRPAQIKPARMKRSKTPAGQAVSITGWGQIDPDDKLKPARLQRADLKLVDRDECNRRYQRPDGPRIISSGLICTEGEMIDGERPDSCSGDSGGPVVLVQRRRVYVIGVMSWGPCGGGDRPSVHGDVRDVRNWILHTMAVEAPPRS